MASRRPRPFVPEIDDRVRAALAAPVDERAPLRPRRIDPRSLPTMGERIRPLIAPLDVRRVERYQDALADALDP